MQETEISFSSRLRELRGSKTQAVIANELNTNQQTYARWELGDRQPKLQDLASIALHFGVTSDWLLGISPASNSKHSLPDRNAGKALRCSVGECQECKKKQEHVDRLERIIDKLTK